MAAISAEVFALIRQANIVGRHIVDGVTYVDQRIAALGLPIDEPMLAEVRQAAAALRSGTSMVLTSPLSDGHRGELIPPWRPDGEAIDAALSAHLPGVALATVVDPDVLDQLATVTPTISEQLPPWAQPLAAVPRLRALMTQLRAADAAATSASPTDVPARYHRLRTLSRRATTLVANRQAGPQQDRALLDVLSQAHTALTLVASAATSSLELAKTNGEVTFELTTLTTAADLASRLASAMDLIRPAMSTEPPQAASDHVSAVIEEQTISYNRRLHNREYFGAVAEMVPAEYLADVITAVEHQRDQLPARAVPWPSGVQAQLTHLLNSVISTPIPAILHARDEAGDEKAAPPYVLYQQGPAVRYGQVATIRGFGNSTRYPVLIDLPSQTRSQ